MWNALCPIATAVADKVTVYLGADADIDDPGVGAHGAGLRAAASGPNTCTMT